MSLFDRLSEYFRSSNNIDEDGYMVYVRCNRCKEPLRVRVNLRHDLSINYDAPKDQSYFCRKTLVGRSGCFERIEIELTFNEKKKLVTREISGGTNINKEEFESRE